MANGSAWASLHVIDSKAGNDGELSHLKIQKLAKTRAPGSKSVLAWVEELVLVHEAYHVFPDYFFKHF